MSKKIGTGKLLNKGTPKAVPPTRWVSFLTLK